MVSFLEQGSWLPVNVTFLPGAFPIVRTISVVSVLIGIAFLLPLILLLILDLTLWCWRIFWNRQPVEEDPVEASEPKDRVGPEDSAVYASQSSPPSQPSRANPRQRKRSTKDNDTQ